MVRRIRVPRPPGTLDDSTFDTLIRLAIGEGADPVDWAEVLVEESGFNPAQPNIAGFDYWGLNQMGTAELRSFGLTPETWLAMTAEQQLPYVARFFRGKNKATGGMAYKSAAHLLACNMLPARVQKTDDVDYPLATRGELIVPGTAQVTEDASKGRPSNFYEDNAIYDLTKTGVITIRGIGDYLRTRIEPSQDWQIIARKIASAIDRLGSVEPGEPDKPLPEPVAPIVPPVVPTIPSASVAEPPSHAKAGIIGLIAVAVGAWFYHACHK